jgi:phosphoribosyl-ATP pyrophosphohydrolase
MSCGQSCIARPPTATRSRAVCVDSGVRAVGKKIISLDGGQYEGPERTAEEIAQLLYHIQCLMLTSKVSLEDVYLRL